MAPGAVGRCEARRFQRPGSPRPFSGLRATLRRAHPAPSRQADLFATWPPPHCGRWPAVVAADIVAALPRTCAAPKRFGARAMTALRRHGGPWRRASRRRSGEEGRGALLRDAERGSSGSGRKRHSKPQRRISVLPGWSEDTLNERSTRAKPRAAGAMRNRALLRVCMVLRCIGVATFVNGAVLHDFTVRTNLNMRVSEYRRQRAQYQRNPDEHELSADQHRTKDFPARPRELAMARPTRVRQWMCHTVTAADYCSQARRANSFA